MTPPLDISLLPGRNAGAPPFPKNLKEHLNHLAGLALAVFPFSRVKESEAPHVDAARRHFQPSQERAQAVDSPACHSPETEMPVPSRRETPPGRSSLPGIVSRTVAGIGGGYLLASACILASAALGPDLRASAIMTASLSSYAIYTAAVVWAFSARTALLAWSGLLAPSALLLAIAGVAHRVARA
ncbi:hypothetical protein ACKI2N_007550 [Cupriavidus sp. 30B13]|uniref:hypothetical protein n=1 Tax=Cupriavidus sp. 30B13 TaxID=3384241 RepID=UPI003B90EDF8